MLCKNGLVKVTDFGECERDKIKMHTTSHERDSTMTRHDPSIVRCPLAGLAAFSNRIDVCPWTQAQPEGGQLSAQLVGGSAMYFSPEQVWLKSKLGTVKHDDEEAYFEIKRHWILTPCISDLFQAAKTVLEMHARPSKSMKKSWQFSPLELTRQCTARTPASVLNLMSPTDAEAWIVDTLKLPQFAGRIAENGLDGSQLLSFCSMSLKEQNTLIKVRSPDRANPPSEAIIDRLTD